QLSAVAMARKSRQDCSEVDWSTGNAPYRTPTSVPVPTSLASDVQDPKTRSPKQRGGRHEHTGKRADLSRRFETVSAVGVLVFRGPLSPRPGTRSAKPRPESAADWIGSPRSSSLACSPEAAEGRDRHAKSQALCH